MVKDTRDDALRAAKDFLDQGLPFVTIISDGHVYTLEEFASTIINNSHLPDGLVLLIPDCDVVSQ